MQETEFDIMPAAPLAMPRRVASGISNLSRYLSDMSFDSSRELKTRTLPGIDPMAEVPKPLKMPVMPSVFNICANNDTPRV